MAACTKSLRAVNDGRITVRKLQTTGSNVTLSFCIAFSLGHEELIFIYFHKSIRFNDDDLILIH